MYNPSMEIESHTSSGKPGEILTKDYVLIFISSVFFMCSLYSLIAILPLYMQDVADASLTDIGLFMGTITVTSFLLRLDCGLARAMMIRAMVITLKAKRRW